MTEVTIPKARPAYYRNDHPHNKPVVAKHRRYPSIKAAAEALRVSPKTIQNRIDSSEFPSYRYVNGVKKERYRTVTVNGFKTTAVRVASIMGVSRSVIKRRIGPNNETFTETLLISDLGIKAKFTVQ